MSASVFISLFVSVFITEARSPKAFNRDEDEAAGPKMMMGVLVILRLTKATDGNLFGGR